MGIVAIPARVFIDTNHLIYMAKIAAGQSLPPDLERRRLAYLSLTKMIHRGQITPLFYEVQAWEWLRDNPSLARAKKLAALLDASPQLMMVESDPTVFAAELLTEVGRLFPHLGIPDLPLVRHFSMTNPVATYLSKFRSVLRTIRRERAVETLSKPNSVTLFLELCFPEIRNGAHKWVNAIDWTRESWQSTRNALVDKPRGTQLPESAIREWLLGYTGFAEMARELGLEGSPEGILEQVDLSRCRATVTFIRAFEVFARSTSKWSDDHDSTDVTFAVPVCLSDHALVDRKWRDLFDRCLRRASTHAPRVFANADSLPQVHSDVTELVGRLDTAT